MLHESPAATRARGLCRPVKVKTFVWIFGHIGSAKTISVPPRVSRLTRLNCKRSLFPNSGDRSVSQSL